MGQCFLAHEGLARVCVDPYVPSAPRNLHRSTMHLTNYSLSKMSDKFVHSGDPEDANTGHKRSLAAVLKHLEDTNAVVGGCNAVWTGLGKLAQQTIDAITEPVLATAFDLGFW